MSEQTDCELLRDYAEHRSAEVFRELVSRHADWVYSAAVRMVGDRELAEDVSQAVFLLLWQRAGKVRGDFLGGWLLKVTRYCASNAMRTAGRRKKHERRAAMMTSEIASEEPGKMWEEVAPVLDGLVSKLRRKDQRVILLRFYQKKSMAEIAGVLGISEEATRKRVGTAVRNLRPMVQRAGITASVVILAEALSGGTSHAAPASVLNCSPGSVSPGAIGIAKGAATMLILNKVKIAAAIFGIILLPVGAGIYVRASSPAAVAPAPVVNPVKEAGVGAPAPPIQPVAAEPPPPIQPVEALDAAVDPFLNSNTAMVIAIDLAGIDGQSVRDRISRMKFIDASSAEWGKRQGAELMNYIGQLQQAGAGQLYMMLVSKGAAQNAPVMIAPLPAGEDSTALSRLMGSNRSQASVVHSAVVSSTDINQIRNAPAEPRGDLIEALATGGTHVRIVYVPSAFNGQHMPDDLQNLGVSTTLYNEKQWDAVTWCLLDLSPAAEQPSAITYRCKDHASAVALAALLKEKANLPRIAPGQGKRLPFFQVIHGKEPAVDGDRVEITLDAGAVDEVILGGMFGRPGK